MIPRFALARPRSLPEAFAAFGEAATTGDVAWIAGGTELLQVMKMGFAQFRTLVDLKGLPELAGIERTADGGLRIGATVTHRDVERSPLVAHVVPGLAALERHLANLRVRNTGTLGGNLAFAEPHSDPATFLLACDARVELAGPGGTRSLAIDEFVLGPLDTARMPDEVLVAIHVPPAAAGEGRAYAKLAFFERPAASVAVRLRVAGGRVAEAVVAVGSLTESPARHANAAAALRDLPAEPAALEAAATTDGLFHDLEVVGDLNGAPDYKRHLATVLLGRAAVAALHEATAAAGAGGGSADA